MLVLRDFIMHFNIAEYKRMGQALSLGQSYDVQNKIKIYTKHWLGLFIYYDTSLMKVLDANARAYCSTPAVTKKKKVLQRCLQKSFRRAGAEEGFRTVSPVRAGAASTRTAGAHSRSGDRPRPRHQVAVSGGRDDAQQRRADDRSKSAVAAAKRAGRLFHQKAEASQIRGSDETAGRGSGRRGRPEFFHFKSGTAILQKPETSHHRDREVTV